MNCLLDPDRRRLLTAAPLLAGGLLAAAVPRTGATAALPVSERFDAAVWAHLLRAGPRPAAYVFTATWCSTCPEAFSVLRERLAARGQQATLAAVLMDAQGAQALAHARHYGALDRLFAFDGSAPAIRHAVDPTWRNIAPYVVLLDRAGRRQSCIGQPDARHLRLWLE